MAEFWEGSFDKMRLMWGVEPTASATMAAERFARRGARRVLIPGVGYGRNARPFLDRGAEVTGIEISATAVELARERLGLRFPIHVGSVADMPFDGGLYDGIFCHGLIYLLEAGGRRKLLGDCLRQLAPGGSMVFTVISKKAPMYGQGACLGGDRYERLPGLGMDFYDAASVEREFGPFGLAETVEVEEPAHGGGSLPFLYAVCEKP